MNAVRNVAPSDRGRDDIALRVLLAARGLDAHTLLAS
jgi:hypothetical protein